MTNRGSILLYGQSSSGKTRLAKLIALNIFAKHGLTTRMVAADPGSGFRAAESLQRLGIIEPTFLWDRPASTQALDRITSGWWPADATDSLSKLVPPKDQPNIGKVGCIIFDGMTHIAGWLQGRNCADEAAGKITIAAQPINYAEGIDKDRTIYGSPQMSHYGNTQRRMTDFVNQSKSRFGSRQVVWTALEMLGEDSDFNKPVFGPDLIGSALTSKIPSWFDNVFHLQMAEAAGKPAHYRMWTRNHFITVSNRSILMIAKNRGWEGKPLPEYLDNENITADNIFSLLDESAAAEDAYNKSLIAGTSTTNLKQG